MAAPTATEKAWGKTRIEALSDGVFAIVVTLLVLEIRIPELPRHAANREVWHALIALGPTLVSFVITFVLAGAFWYLHHFTFHNIKYVTRGMCLVNLGAVAVAPSASYYGFTFVMIIGRRIARHRFKPLPADAPAPL